MNAVWSQHPFVKTQCFRQFLYLDNFPKTLNFGKVGDKTTNLHLGTFDLYWNVVDVFYTRYEMVCEKEQNRKKEQGRTTGFVSQVCSVFIYLVPITFFTTQFLLSLISFCFCLRLWPQQCCIYK